MPEKLQIIRPYVKRVLISMKILKWITFDHLRIGYELEALNNLAGVVIIMEEGIIENFEANRIVNKSMSVLWVWSSWGWCLDGGRQAMNGFSSDESQIKRC